MLVQTRSIGFPLTDAIRDFAESRTIAALGPLAARVQSVTIRLEDVNGDRGGVDKRCRIVVALRRRPSVIAEATHTDLYAAIDDARDRIRRTLVRTLERKVRRERTESQRAEALALA